MIQITVPQIAIDALLLGVRIVLAVAFLHEARLKFANVRAFAKSHDIPVGAAVFTATAELAAAGGMLTGILAQLAGIGVMILMVLTTAMVVLKWHGQYWAQRGGWEYDVMLFVLAAVVVCFGAGAFVIAL